MKTFRNLLLASLMLVGGATTASAQDISNIQDDLTFSTAQEAALHNNDALACCKYYLSHKLDNDNMTKASKVIANWTTVSEDVMVTICANDKWMDAQHTAYVCAYLAGWSEYALTNNVKECTLEAYIAAIKATVAFYNQNKQLAGFSRYLEKYAKMDDATLNEQLKKNFQVMLK